jgi:replicative DNA helicase
LIPDEAKELVVHNTEAEEAVLGSALINPRALIDIRWLRPDDFYVVRNRWIWEVLCDLFTRGEPIDFLTVSDELEKAGKLVEMGGEAYLMGLLNQVPSSLHAEAYAKLVHATGVRRRLLDAANKIAKLAYTEDVDIEDITTKSSDAVSDAISTMSLGKEEAFETTLSEYYVTVKERGEQPNFVLGIPTGFRGLDKLLGGIKNKYYLIGGRPGDNKTSLMLNFVLSFAKIHKRVLYFSLEQDEEELMNLLASIESGIANDVTNLGKLSTEEGERFDEAFNLMMSLKEYIVFDTVSETVPTIHAKIEKVKPDVVIIDSMGFLRGHEDAGTESMRINAIGRDVKLLHRRVKIPIIMVTHMSRSIEQADREPRLADFNQGGEKDCDVAMFIRKPSEVVSPPGLSTRRISVLKHRGGRLGAEDLIIRENCTKFMDSVTRTISFGNSEEKGRDYTV